MPEPRCIYLHITKDGALATQPISASLDHNMKLVRVAVLMFAFVAAPMWLSLLLQPDLALVVFGILPAIVAIAVIGVSARSIVRNFSVPQLALGMPTIGLSVIALWGLQYMFVHRGATYLPYIVIAFTIPLATIQQYVARDRRRKNVTQTSEKS